MKLRTSDIDSISLQSPIGRIVGLEHGQIWCHTEVETIDRQCAEDALLPQAVLATE